MLKDGRISIKHLIGSGVLVVVSLAISAMLGEGFLRLWGYHGAPESMITNMYSVDDPVLDWRYLPHSQVVIDNITNSYNSRGFRDVEHSIQRSPGITRIVVLGDSVTEGYGVKAEFLFVRQLQESLGDKYEVVNLSMAGLNTPQEVHLFQKEGLQYDPSLVILNVVLNDADFFTTYRGAQKAIEKADQKIGMFNLRVDPRIKKALKSSALIYFVKNRVENLYGLMTGAGGSNYYQELWSKETNRDKVRNGFDRLRILREQFAFEVLVVIWPVLTEYQNYPFSEIHEWIAGEARKNRFHVHDLLPVFSKMHFRDLQVAAEDSIHPNARGHKLAADSVVGLRDRLESLR